MTIDKPYGNAALFDDTTELLIPRRTSFSPRQSRRRNASSPEVDAAEDLSISVVKTADLLQKQTLAHHTRLLDLPTEVMRHVDAYLSPNDILNMMRTSRSVHAHFYDFSQDEFDRLTSRFFGLAMSIDEWCQQTPYQQGILRSQRLKKLLSMFIEVEAQAAILVAVRPRRLDARGLFIRRTVLGETYCYAMMDALAGKLLSSSHFDANRLHQRMQRKSISDAKMRSRGQGAS